MLALCQKYTLNSVATPIETRGDWQSCLRSLDRRGSRLRDCCCAARAGRSRESLDLDDTAKDVGFAEQDI